MKILIAPNSFKNCLTNFQVAQYIQRGLNKSNLKIHSMSLFPISDGGDNTILTFSNLFNIQPIKTQVRGPLAKLVQSHWILNQNQIAFLELAQASGIHLMRNEQLNPLKTNSYGVGQLILQARKRNAKQIVIGIGGSATIDGGAGILQAFGAKFYDKNKQQIKEGNLLVGLQSLNLYEVNKDIFNMKITILADVSNPLIGQQGAVNVYGPQKGANKDMIILLQNSMKNWVKILSQHNFQTDIQIKGGGAAGGIGYMLSAVFKSQIISGAQYIISKTIKNIGQYDLIITGQGKIDNQSFKGKAPFVLAQKAKQQGVPIICICGQIQDIWQMNKYFDMVDSISHRIQTLEEAIVNGKQGIQFLSKQIGNLLSIKNK